jgi:hypothetical protein
MPDEKTSVPDGQTDKAQDASKSSSEEGTSTKTTEAPSNLPEKLQGKTSEDLIKMYGELERKLGEQSTLVSEAKKIKENQEILAKAILSDPKLTKSVESAVQALYGNTEDSGKKSDEEAAGKIDPQIADLRRSQENRTIAEFSNRYGMDKLKPDERQEMLKKVGSKLADMVDSTGKLTMAQVISSISLDRLPVLLEDAYWLVNKDNLMDKGSLPQDLASIGRFSSSTSKSEEEIQLTDKEKEMAVKLGIKPEQYLKQKQQLVNK